MFAYLLALASAAPAPTTDTRVVVFELESTPELAPLAKRTSEQLLLYLGKKSGLSAISQAEIQLLVEHNQAKNELMRCETEACLDELSKATAADKLISGHLGRWGDGYLVTLSMVDVTKKTVERGESATGDSEKELAEAVTPALDRLLGLAGRAERAGTFTLGPSGTKLAVLDLAAHGATQSLADNVTQLLAIELKKVEGLSVISRDEIKTMLEYEAEKQIAQCKSDTACLLEIGGALGVQYLVSGAIGKLEDTFVINLKLIEIQKAEVVRRASETYRGPERHLNQALRFAVRDLLGLAVEGKGDLSVTTEISSARSKIDGDQLIHLPQRVGRLAAGKHTLATLADGYAPSYQEFYVEPNVTTVVRPDLVALPTEWYEEWWVWALVGTAVVGAAGAGVLIATDTPDNGGVDVVIHPR